MLGIIKMLCFDDFCGFCFILFSFVYSRGYLLKLYDKLDSLLKSWRSYCESNDKTQPWIYFGNLKRY